MKIVILANSWVVTVLLAGCSGSRSAPVQNAVERANGRTEATLNASLDSMRGKMTPTEIREFTDALVRIGSRVSHDDRDDVNRALRERLDGKSVAEILADGKEH